jgi:hypothetical protein
LTHVQLGSLQPDIFALRAELATFGNELPRSDHLVGMNLESSGGDPSGSMFGVGLNDGVEKSSSSLDVTVVEAKGRVVSMRSRAVGEMRLTYPI